MTYKKLSILREENCVFRNHALRMVMAREEKEKLLALLRILVWVQGRCPAARGIGAPAG